MSELCESVDKARKSGKANDSWEMRNQLVSIHLAEGNRDLIKQTAKAYDYFSQGKPPASKKSRSSKPGCMSLLVLWPVAGAVLYQVFFN